MSLKEIVERWMDGCMDGQWDDDDRRWPIIIASLETLAQVS